MWRLFQTKKMAPATSANHFILWYPFQTKNEALALSLNQFYFVASVQNKKCGTSYKCKSVSVCGTRPKTKNVAPAISVDQFYFLALFLGNAHCETNINASPFARYKKKYCTKIVAMLPLLF